MIPLFKQGLSETGFIEGRNLAITYRWADEDDGRLPALAADLVQQGVSVIAASTTPAALAAKAATAMIPVVFRLGSDPVAIGLVATLNRPGANVTGIANITASMTPKRLELLHKLVPTASSIGVLTNPANPIFSRAETQDLQSAASLLGIRLLLLDAAATEAAFVAAFARIAEEKVGALLISAATSYFAVRETIISLAARYAVPAMFGTSTAVAAGGFASYGPSPDSNRQLGVYVGRVLQGEKPADLPVNRTTRFEFVINLQTAKALGLALPPPVLALADRVVE
jgi:putative ABC transport system substrate-binding protein